MYTKISAPSVLKSFSSFFMASYALKKIYHHPDLIEEELVQIFEAHQKTEIKKGAYFLKKGQIANEYYCIEKGLARAYVMDFNGNDITTSFFSENEIVIDVVSLFQRIRSKENIQALTDCVCWKIDYDPFQSLFHTIDAFSEWGRVWMTQNLFQLKQRSISMITETAKDRYLTLQSQHPQIIQQAPLKYIASYLGITDTSLSRIRKELAQN